MLLGSPGPIFLGHHFPQCGIWQKNWRAARSFAKVQCQPTLVRETAGTFSGITYERLSDRVNAAIENSLAGSVAKSAKQAEEQAKHAQEKAAEIERVRSQLKAGEFDGDISVRGNVTVQGKVLTGGGFGKSECELVDGLNKSDYLTCKEGFYVAGARNSSDSARTIDQILCCRSR